MAASTSFAVYKMQMLLFASILLLVASINVANAQDEQDEIEQLGKEDFTSESFENNLGDIPTDLKEKDFYSFSVYDITGKLVSLEKYRGKVTLVVNVASACGFTDSHYKALIRMKNVLSVNDKFEVLAFPCNQFGGQEPESNPVIETWAHDNYMVNFPMFSKINVLDENVPEAWQYLIEKSGKAPNWNFWKYLVTENGHVVDAWGPRVPVEDIFQIIREHVDSVKPVKPVQPSAEPAAQRTVPPHGEL